VFWNSTTEKTVRGILDALFWPPLWSRSISEFTTDAASVNSSTDSSEVLADLVGDFLPRLSSSSAGHAFLLALGGSRRVASFEPAWLIRSRLSIRISQGQIMEKAAPQMTVVGISKPGGPEVLLPETRFRSWSRGNPGQGDGRRRQPSRRRAAVRRLPAAAGASDLPGLEIAGEVVRARRWRGQAQARDKVMSCGRWRLPPNIASRKTRRR